MKEKTTIMIDNIRFIDASPRDVKKGFLGWVSLTLNDSLRLDGISLRRTRDNRLALSFPYRRDKSGHQHNLVLPLGEATRREIEDQIFEALAMKGECL